MAESLQKFLKFHHLEEKKLILFGKLAKLIVFEINSITAEKDFPSSVEGLKACEATGLHASSVIEVIPENHQICKDKDPSTGTDLVKFLWRRRMKVHFSKPPTWYFS
jgi:hypothetical protein